MKKIHYLKTWPVFFADIRGRKKTFEIRRNDRDFSVGDTIVAQEWSPEAHAANPDNPSAGYSGKEIRGEVKYVLRGEECPDGLAHGFVAMSVQWTCGLEGATR